MRDYKPCSNFCAISLDKTDHVVQIPQAGIGRYTPFDLIFVWLKFGDRK